MTIPVPSLSTAGWVTSLQQKADLVMAHMFEAMENQTYTYPGQVTSIQYIIEQNAGNIPKTCSAIQSAIEHYLKRYYDLATVQITSDDVTGTNVTSIVTLSIYAEVTEGGVVYPFQGLVELANGAFQRFVSLNNTGQSVASTVIQSAST